jgi:murein DD-endopeptidase MepM/ murein hydrolase activator NlpD
MASSSDGLDRITVCGVCEGSLDQGRYVQLEPWLPVFCSEPCFRDGMREQRLERWAERRRAMKTLAVSTILIGALLTPHRGPGRPRAPRPDRPAPAARPANDSGAAVLPPGWFGPDWPPTETSLLAALGRDAWIHPLAGPLRRMPRSDSRVFGAVRPGERAVECRNGHCGVDLGGEIWGEHVRAVHDGVVDWVQRASNPLHGGLFVRLSHRSGTVFTQYFHLAAIPRGLERGMAVKGGEVIGLLGDSGVKESAPHLHFTISVRPSKELPEKYVDPEPLIALWPLRVPLDGSEVGLVTTLAQVGVPLGSAPARSVSQRRLARHRRSPGEGATTDANGPTEGSGAPAGDDAPAEGASSESSMEE